MIASANIPITLTSFYLTMKGLSITALLIAGASALTPSTRKLAARADPDCQTDLSGAYEFPHLIVPVDSGKPDEAPGTSYDGTVGENTTSLFNFDIPGNDLQQCTLVFIFPGTEEVGKNVYTFDGDGKVSFGLLDDIVSPETTYNNKPDVQTDYPPQTLEPGNTYTIANFDCPGDQPMSFQMANAGSTHLRYFQDYGENP